MQELSLQTAVFRGVGELNLRGLEFNPDEFFLTNEFRFLSQHYSGVIALPTTEDRTGKGYELVKFTIPDIDLPDITLEDLWECAKKHYGLTAAAGLTGVAGIPIKKMKHGYPVIGNASKNTNIMSHIGTKFFPMATLPAGSPVARLAKATFGTTRIFGIVGRSLWPVAIGLAVFDVVSIGICAYEELNEK